MTKTVRKQFKVYFTEQEREILDEQAKELGLTRGEIIRRRALSAPAHEAGLPQGSHVYADALEAAARSYSGIPRTAMAGIVSAVIKSLAEH